MHNMMQNKQMEAKIVPPTEAPAVIAIDVPTKKK